MAANAPGLTADDILSPLQAIDRMFESVGENELNGDWGVPEAFKKVLLDGQARQNVYSLNHTRPEDIESGSFVRYKGLVQDMYDVEYYPGRVQHTRADGEEVFLTGRFRDEIIDGEYGPVVVDVMENITGMQQRQPLYAIPLPGEAQWSMAADGVGWKQVAPPSDLNTSERKRQRPDSDDEDDDTTGGDALLTDQHANVGAGSAVPAAAAGYVAMGGGEGSGASEGTPAKKNKHEQLFFSEAATATSYSSSKDLNLPLAYENRAPALLLCYEADDNNESPVKVNDVVEVYGILSLVPDNVLFEDDPDGQAANEFYDEKVAHNPPSSLVPRIHAVCFNKLGSLCPHSMEAQLGDTATATATRARLHAYISTALGGDDVAADYVLLNMVSSVQQRASHGPLGTLPLNLTHPALDADASVANVKVGTHPFFVDGSYPHAAFTPLNDDGTPAANLRAGELAFAVWALYQVLLPASVYAALTVNSLNNALWFPHKNYKKNRLTTGPLQLAPGSCLVIDETTMSSGQLQGSGVRNLQALKSAVQFGTVEYDFEHYRSDFPVDVKTVVVSQGRTLLEMDMMLPVKPKHQLCTPLEETEFIEQARAYLQAAANIRPEMDSTLQEIISEYFVEQRAKEGSKVSAENLHNWLTMTKLHAQSRGSAVFNGEDWSRVVFLEGIRAQRAEKSATPAAAASTAAAAAEPTDMTA